MSDAYILFVRVTSCYELEVIWNWPAIDPTVTHNLFYQANGISSVSFIKKHHCVKVSMLILHRFMLSLLDKPCDIFLSCTTVDLLNRAMKGSTLIQCNLCFKPSCIMHEGLKHFLIPSKLSCYSCPCLAWLSHTCSESIVSYRNQSHPWSQQECHTCSATIATWTTCARSLSLHSPKSHLNGQNFNNIISS